MNNNKTIHLMQGTLRAGVCLFMLSGACVLSAQTPDAGHAPKEPAKHAPAPAKKAPTYEMKEISGYVFDGATKKPVAGVKVQALNNRYYTAMTDESGRYIIRVPEFVDVLYLNTEGYNPAQLAVKDHEAPDAFLTSGMNADFYTDGTSLNNNAVMYINEPNSLTIENEMEKGLAGNLRMVTRGGMPAQGAVMFMNGLNSLNSSAQPLVIIDGVMIDMQYDRTSIHQGFVNNVFNIVDPDDIESVEVVKNGTALYGAKGANGVLIVKTRRGKSMATRINFRAYAGFETAPEQMKMMNADQYRNYFSELIGTIPNRESDASSKTINFLNNDPNSFYYNLYHNETDWQKDLYHDTFTQNYKVSVDGGDEVAMYHLSLGYAQSDATARGNDFNRLNIRFNTDVNLFKNLVTGIDFSYARNAYNLRDNGWAEDYTSSNIASPNVLGLIQTPFISPYAYYAHKNSDTGKWGLVASDHVYAGKTYSDTNNPFSYASAYGFTALVNPFWILENGDGNNKNYQEQTQFNLNVSPNYKVNKYITIADRFSYILNRTNEKYYLPSYGTPPKTVEGLGDVTSVVKSQFGKETTLYNDFNVDWHRNFGAHDIDLFGGFRIGSYSYSASHLTGYNNDQDKMPNISYSLQYRDYGGANDRWNNMAYYLNASYNYKNKYFLEGIVSMEASSRFGKKADSGLHLFGVSWGVFPSLQAGWVISSEKWFNVPGIDYLKLTAGYGLSGNDNIDYYATRTYFVNTKFLDKATALVLANIQNPKLQWETTGRFNVGLQTSLLHNRVNVGIEYFRSRTTNLLTRKSVSDITGIASMWSNDGTLENRGVDFNVNALLIQRKDWRWQAGFTIGHYKNEITELPSTSLNTIKHYSLDANGQKDQLTEIHGYTSSIYGTDNILTAVGQAAGVFYGYKTKGVFSTDEEARSAGKDGNYLKYPTGISGGYRNFQAGDVHFVDQNGDGWINEADMVVIGDPNPDFYGNIYTSLSWKGLKLDVNFKYSVGNDVYNYQRSQLESLNTNWNQTTAAVNRWRYSGQVTNIPRAMTTSSDSWVNNERFSDRWIEDGSYLKLKNIRLTYNIPVRLSWLLGLSVWGECNNVFTITKYTGTDPEVTAGNSVLYQGIDAGLLTQGRNFSLGVTINL